MGTVTEYLQNIDMETRQRAMERFTDTAARDKQIVACFFYGSTIRGDYWEGSDIDVILITTDETVGVKPCIFEEEGQWFEAYMFSRSLFREISEGMTTAAGPSSMRRSGKLAYCSDSSLEKYFRQDNRLESYEQSCRLYQEAAWWHFYFQKLNKYCGLGKQKRAYHTLGFAIQRFAALHILSHGIVPEREVVEQALELSPTFFTPYAGIIYGTMPSLEIIREVTGNMKAHIRSKLTDYFRLLLSYMRDENQMLPLSEIHTRFSGILNSKLCELTFGACELLCSAGILERSSMEYRPTKRSTASFMEPAYIYTQGNEYE